MDDRLRAHVTSPPAIGRSTKRMKVIDAAMTLVWREGYVLDTSTVEVLDPPRVLHPAICSRLRAQRR